MRELYRVGRALALFAALFGPAAWPGAVAAADFAGQPVSDAARETADWAVRSGDHAGLPFIVVDKVASAVFVFDAAGRLRGAGPALLGLARGDQSVPGIGERALSAIRPHERTTPAGRFVARLDLGLQGEEILWVDYESAVALHPVSAGNPAEQRLRRLASSRPADRRITFGCINVARQFFESVVVPAFRGTPGIVYVLPETRRPREVFGWQDGGR